MPSEVANTKKLPVFYISIVLDKPMRRIYLLKLYLYFTITSNVTNSTDLINNELDGTYSMEVAIDNTHKELNNKIYKYNGLRRMISMFTTFLQSNDMISYIKELVETENNRIKQEFIKQYSNYTIPKVTVSLKNYNLDDDDHNN